MKKLIIPRKDHEVYFFALPEGIKKKQLKSYAFEQLEKMHPSFSAFLALDLKLLVLTKKRWIMATIMKEELLSEYKILHKNTIFYTNTSISVHEKAFINMELKAIDDELIGFNKNKEEPVSIPLESPTKGNSGFLTTDLKKTSIKYGVYNKKNPKRYITSAFACLFIVTLLSFALFPSEKPMENSKIEPSNVFTDEFYDYKQMPSSIEILASISTQIVEEKGKILSWRYQEDNNPFIIIQTQGLDILSAYQIAGEHEYLSMMNIQDIKYIDEKPNFTLFMNTSTNGYSKAINEVFPPQNHILPILSDLKKKLQEHEISLISELFPTDLNGNFLYTITYTAKDRNLIQSFEIINDFCAINPLTVNSMDVSINSDSNLFTVVSSFSYTNETREITALLDENLNKIPIAFGYMEEKQAPLITVITLTEKLPEPPILGSIRDDSGQFTFYRDLNDGKIRIREEL